MKKDVDDRLQAALRDLDYVRVKKNVYRAPWSSEPVAHYISTRWLNWFGEREAVEVTVGLRHHEAQAFAVDMIQRFNHPGMTEVLKLGPTDCPIQFSLGRLCSWSERWFLDLSVFGIEGTADRITYDLGRWVRPLIGRIGDDATMYDFLTQTAEKRMSPVNGAFQAAEAIFLGRRLGFPRGKVFAELEPFAMYIKACINRSRSVDDYLSEIWENAGR
jgi:hypothetical protein